MQIAAILLVGWQTSNLQTYAQSRLILPAVQDAYVNGGKARENFGRDEELTVKKSNTGKQDRRFYLRFDLPKATEPIRFAMLDCKVTSTSETPIGVGVTVANWRESLITWSNRPEKVTWVEQLPALGGGRMLVDVTKTIRQAQKAKVKSVTIRFRSEGHYEKELSYCVAREQDCGRSSEVDSGNESSQ